MLSFSPEKENFSNSEEKLPYQLVGDTLMMKHLWAPQISGVLEKTKENTTWYAETQIWSDENKQEEFWIGFNNLSRSIASDSPNEGTWNNLNSKIWVNNILIAPPNWKHPNQKGNPEIPLIDEGYEYREREQKINLIKGWNTITVKLPTGSIVRTNLQNIIKWMFTFVKAKE